jgi:hypothetical protein
VWPVPGRCASHGTATYDSSRPAQDSCSLGLLDRTPATDFEEASGAAQAAPGIPVQCVVSERARARNAQCPWFWSTTTSKSQEFGGLQPRDEPSRNPSLGLPRVGGEPHRGRPVFSGPALAANGGANVWHILLDPSWLHKQASVGLRCRRLLELLKPSDPVGHLLWPRDVLAHRPSAKSGTPPSSSARHATAAHTSSSSTHLMFGSAALLHPRDERSSHLAFGWSRPHHGANRRCHSVTE